MNWRTSRPINSRPTVVTHNQTSQKMITNKHALYNIGLIIMCGSIYWCISELCEPFKLWHQTRWPKNQSEPIRSPIQQPWHFSQCVRDFRLPHEQHSRRRRDERASRAQHAFTYVQNLTHIRNDWACCGVDRATRKHISSLTYARAWEWDRESVERGKWSQIN